MGNTYKKQRSDFDDEFTSKRRKASKHTSGRKTHGMVTLNRYVEEDYEEVLESDYDTQHTNIH